MASSKAKATRRVSIFASVRPIDLALISHLSPADPDAAPESNPGNSTRSKIGRGIFRGDNQQASTDDLRRSNRTAIRSSPHYGRGSLINYTQGLSLVTG